MKAFTHTDVVAANFRNAFFDALPADALFRNDYEVMDAKVLEVAYKHLDRLDDEIVEVAYKAIVDGAIVKYNPEVDDFFMVTC